MKVYSVLAILLLFFISSITSAHAYTVYNGNEYFTDSINQTSYGFHSPYGNETLAEGDKYNVSYVETCNARTGCLKFLNQGNGGEFDVLPRTAEETLGFVLPANTEGLIYISYRVNATLSAPTTLVIYGDYENTTYLPSTPNTWINYNTTIPASSEERNIGALFEIFVDAVPTNVTIDKFMLFTVDEVTTDPLESNWTLNYMAFCDATSTQGKDGTTDRGYFFCTTPESYDVSGVTFNGTTITRRISHMYNAVSCTHNSGFFFDAAIMATRSYYLLGKYETDYSSGCCEYYNLCNVTGAFMLEKMSLSTIKITSLVAEQPAHEEIYVQTNGTIPARIYYWNHTLFTGILADYPYATQLELNTIPYSNTTTPAGNGWKYYAGEKGLGSTVFPFFSYNSISYPAGTYCDVGTNLQYFLTANGTRTDEIYCGDCGCNGDGINHYCITSANYVGTECLLDDNASLAFVYYYYDVCTYMNITGACDYGTACVNHDLDRGIECLNLDTGGHDFCVNMYGELVDCSTFTNTTFLTFCIEDDSWVDCPTDAFSVLSLWLLGWASKDWSVTNSVLSLIISLAISFLMLFIARHDRNYAGLVFLATIVLMITIFTLLGLFNPLVWALLAVVDIFLIYSIYKDAG